MLERNRNIDILRGIAIIMVLLGHAIQRGLVVNFDQNILFKFIYTFHMPLFIILSGYTLFLSTKIYNFSFLKKKFFGLLFPTFLWSYILFFIKDLPFVGIKPFINFPDSITSFTKTLIFNPNYIFWFLYVLFVYNFIIYIAKKLPEKYFLPFLIIIQISLQFLPMDHFGIFQISLYFPLYILGYYIAKYKDFLLDKLNFLFIPSLVYYLINFKDWLYYNDLVKYYTMAFAAIIVLYCLVKKIKKIYISTALTWLGKNSLGIYLYQTLCLNIGYGDSTIRIITIFISASIIASLLSYLTNKNKYISAFLYGNFKKLKE